MKGRSYNGKYSLKNPNKYRGDINNVIWRSTWELKLMKWFDENPSVLSWSSEEIVIPYYNPLDKKYHRYFVDFWVRVKEKDGSITERLVEVKPLKQTIEPTKPAKINKRYLAEMQNWIINSSKWEAAKKVCDQKKWQFMILTEKSIFGDKYAS